MNESLASTHTQKKKVRDMHLQPQNWGDADRKFPGVWLAACLAKLMGSKLNERSFLRKKLRKWMIEKDF